MSLVISYINKHKLKKKIIIGWREWVAFPELGINRIKAKIDTGARTSTLHALNISVFSADNGKMKVKFQVYPEQYNLHYVLDCHGELLDQRLVRNSGGNAEYRYIIKTNLYMAGSIWPIELTLTNRATMGFRLLLGRTALNTKFLVDPCKSFLV